jgi:hypothetical protein
MGYSFEEFFDDNILPDMLEIFKNYDKEKEDNNMTGPSISDRFLGVLARGVEHDYRGDELRRRLIDTAMNNEYGEITPEAFIKKCFDLYYTDLSLRKIEYVSEEDTVVNINYHGRMEEEELLNKIAELKANKRKSKTDF